MLYLNWNWKVKFNIQNLKLKSKTYIENSNWNGYWNICKSQMLMSSNVFFQFVNIALFSMVKEVFDWKVFDPFWRSADGFLGLGLFQHMFHNLLIYTYKYCFGCVVVFCFFKAFPDRWLGEKSDFNENSVVSLGLDLDFGLQLRVFSINSSRVSQNLQEIVSNYNRE